MLQRIDNEWSTLFHVPVTLRQLEEAGIALDSRFGMDDAEHEELLDEDGLLRLVFGVQVEEAEAGYEVRRVFTVESYSSTLGQAARWEDCLAKEAPSPYNSRSWFFENRIAVERLVRRLVGDDQVDALLGQAGALHQEWIDELEAD